MEQQGQRHCGRLACAGRGLHESRQSDSLLHRWTPWKDMGTGQTDGLTDEATDGVDYWECNSGTGSCVLELEVSAGLACSTRLLSESSDCRMSGSTSAMGNPVAGRSASAVHCGAAGPSDTRKFRSLGVLVYVRFTRHQNDAKTQLWTPTYSDPPFPSDRELRCAITSTCWPTPAPFPF
jgi:hypothetical protein